MVISLKRLKLKTYLYKKGIIFSIIFYILSNSHQSYKFEFKSTLCSCCFRLTHLHYNYKSLSQTLVWILPSDLMIDAVVGDRGVKMPFDDVLLWSPLHAMITSLMLWFIGDIEFIFPLDPQFTLCMLLLTPPDLMLICSDLGTWWSTIGISWK